MEDISAMGFSKDDFIVNVYPISDRSNFSGKSFDSAAVNKKVNQKRYDSLLELQNQVLSATEKRKRDVAQRKLKNKANLEASTDIEGRSLSDSDFKASWSRHTKVARKALKLGKKLGIHFIGDGEEILQEIATLERSDEFEVCWFAADGHSGGFLSIWVKLVKALTFERDILIDLKTTIKGYWFMAGVVNAVRRSGCESSPAGGYYLDVGFVGDPRMVVEFKLEQSRGG
ncbi:hypothetical protein V6N11_082456 [Hibiscus sabdariffa]|uniref:Uncharacterized protein n=2 Tax=Hibiscus sabdariffa TaxID=183260 RepID=A0ABR2BU02_9ROSI